MRTYSPASALARNRPDRSSLLGFALVFLPDTLSTPAGNLGPLWASGLLVAVALLIAFPLRTVVAVGRSAKVLR